MSITGFMVLAVGLVVAKMVLSLVFKSAKVKGKIGEAIVSRRLRKNLPEGEYTVIDDVYLPIEGGTTQIDHLVVSKFGVFVVETKNYTGWIYADGKSKVWTQVVFRQKHTQQNPIRQNYLHVCTIADLLGVPKEILVGVVAFTGDCEFKTPIPDGVVYSRRLANYIQGFNRPILKNKEVAAIVEAIREWQNSVSPEERKRHVANLRKRHGG